MSEAWELVRLGDVCELQNGFAFKSKYFRPNGVPVLRISSIQDELVSDNRPVFTDPADYNEDLTRYKVHNGDLLIAMSGATTGKVGFNRTGKTFLLNQRVGKFKPTSKLSIDFLFLYLVTKVEENLEISAGAAQPNLSTKQINDFVIPLPPLPEQKRIVAILDEAFAGITRAVAHAEKNLANARELFESYLNAIFTRKGEGWVEKTLGEVCDLQNGFAFKSKSYVKKSNTLNIRMSSIRPNGRFDPEHNIRYLPDTFAAEYSQYQLKKGDLVIAMTDMAGDPKILGVPTLVSSLNGRTFLLNQRVGKLHGFSKRLFVPFLRYFLAAPNVKDYYKSKGAGGLQVNISKKDILSVPISFPSITIQKLIVGTLDSFVSETQRLETIYQQKLTALAELKQSILQKAFAGELTAEPEATTKEGAIA